MLQTIRVQVDDDVLTLRTSLAGRLVAGAERGLLWGAVGLFGLLIMFSPDVVFDWIWGRVEGSPSVTVLVLTMAGLATMIGVIGAVVRMLRVDVWAVDAARGVLQFQTAPLMGAPVQERVELDQIERVVVTASSIWGTSGIRVMLSGDRPPETLVASRFAGADVRRAARQIEQFLADHDLGGDIEVVEESNDAQEA
jgi:hypothetical protein